MNCPNAYLTIPGLSGETETETEIVQEIDKLEQGLWTRRDQSTSNYYGSTSLADLRYISFVQCSLCLMLFPWSWQSVGMSKNRFPRFRDRTTGPGTGSEQRVSCIIFNCDEGNGSDYFQAVSGILM